MICCDSSKFKLDLSFCNPILWIGSQEGQELECEGAFFQNEMNYLSSIHVTNVATPFAQLNHDNVIIM